MSPLENNITNLTHKEQVPDEIDLFDIIRFLIVNRVFILLGLCLGALFSLSYITYRHFYSSTTTTTTTIPVKATGIAQNEFYSSLNLAYINHLFKVLRNIVLPISLLLIICFIVSSTIKYCELPIFNFSGSTR